MTSTAFAAAAVAPLIELVCSETVRRELERVRGYQRSVGYALEGSRSLGLYTLLTDLFMTVNSPRLEALTVELLETVHQAAPRGSSRRRATFRLARSLHGMGLLPKAIPHRFRTRSARSDGIPRPVSLSLLQSRLPTSGPPPSLSTEATSSHHPAGFLSRAVGSPA